jgi:hypothetical protein
MLEYDRNYMYSFLLYIMKNIVYRHEKYCYVNISYDMINIIMWIFFTGTRNVIIVWILPTSRKKIKILLSHPRERSAAILDWFRGLCCLCKRESPPSIMVTRKPNWSFRDSKARDWLRKGKVLAPLVRPT